MKRNSEEEKRRTPNSPLFLAFEFGTNRAIVARRVGREGLCRGSEAKFSETTVKTVQQIGKCPVDGFHLLNRPSETLETVQTVGGVGRADQTAAAQRTVAQMIGVGEKVLL